MSTLYIVATPIGNLADITYRAVEVLGKVDTVVAEDTRRVRKLLSAYHIPARTLSCPPNREREVAEKVVTLLTDGKDAAFASDAGTPNMSDPGQHLVAAVRDAGFRVVPVPGPSAATTLMSVCGTTAKGAIFEGFLSPKSGRRRRRLAELIGTGMPFILFESPFRILKVLGDLAELSPERRIFLGREMTKMHEEFLEGAAADLLEILTQRPAQKGEFTLLVSGEKKK